MQVRQHQAVRTYRKLAVVELPASLLFYAAARLAASHASGEPGGIAYVLVLVAVVLLGATSVSFSLLAAILTRERMASLGIAFSSLLITVAGSASTALAFTAPTPAKPAYAALSITSIIVLGYNTIQTIELLSGGKRQYQPTPHRLRP